MPKTYTSDLEIPASPTIYPFKPSGEYNLLGKLIANPGSATFIFPQLSTQIDYVDKFPWLIPFEKKKLRQLTMLKATENSYFSWKNSLILALAMISSSREWLAQSQISESLWNQEQKDFQEVSITCSRFRKYQCLMQVLFLNLEACQARFWGEVKTNWFMQQSCPDTVSFTTDSPVRGSFDFTVQRYREIVGDVPIQIFSQLI